MTPNGAEETSDSVSDPLSLSTIWAFEWQSGIGELGLGCLVVGPNAIMVMIGVVVGGDIGAFGSWMRRLSLSACHHGFLCPLRLDEFMDALGLNFTGCRPTSVKGLRGPLVSLLLMGVALTPTFSFRDSMVQ